jgi:CheY-like chemotaxis protein
MDLIKNDSYRSETPNRRDLVGLGFETKPKVEMLIVEDSEDSAELFSLAVSGFPAHLAMAKSAVQGIDFLSRHPIDLLVLDWNLGGISGEDFIKTFLENRERFQNSKQLFYLVTYSGMDTREIRLPEEFHGHYLGHFRKGQSFSQMKEKFGRIFNMLMIREGFND